MVLGCAEEAFGDGHLVGYLPGMAGCLARRVAWAVGGRGGNRAGRLHALCGLSTFADVFNGDGPGGLGWLLALARV